MLSIWLYQRHTLFGVLFQGCCCCCFVFFGEFYVCLGCFYFVGFFCLFWFFFHFFCQTSVMFPHINVENDYIITWRVTWQRNISISPLGDAVWAVIEIQDIEISCSLLSCSETDSRIPCRSFQYVSSVSFYASSKTDFLMFLVNQWHSQKAFSATQSLVYPGLVKSCYFLFFSAWMYSTAESILLVGVFYVFEYCETCSQSFFFFFFLCLIKWIQVSI